MPHNSAQVNMARYAASVRSLLDEDPRRYRNFGPYWWFVKALLARYYDRAQCYYLGGYHDPAAADGVPAGISARDALAAAAETYQTNAKWNLGSNRVSNADGEEFVIFDPDAEG